MLKGFLTKDQTYPVASSKPVSDKGWWATVWDTERRLYRLEYWGKGRFDPAENPCRMMQTLWLQGWFWGGCSSCGAWGWSAISLPKPEEMAEFLLAFKEVFMTAGSGYNPHRIFVQCPVGKEYGFGTVYRHVRGKETNAEALPKPAYRFENKSHSSVEQRIYDVDADEWWQWAEDFQRKTQESKKDYHENEKQGAAGKPVGGVLVSGGQRTVAHGGFVPAVARAH